MAKPTQEEARRTVEQTAALGLQVDQLLGTEAFQAGITLAKARIFTDWAKAKSVAEREALHAEQRALDRLLEAFDTLNDEGLVARVAIKRWREDEMDTSLPDAL